MFQSDLRHFWHQHPEEWLCHPIWKKTTKWSCDWLRPGWINDLSVSLLFVSHLQARPIGSVIPLSDLVGFDFHSKHVLDIHPPPVEPLHKKAGTGLKRYNTGYGCLLHSLNQFYLSLSLSVCTIPQLVFHYNKNLQLCPPFKRVKAFLGKNTIKIELFANQTWGHFCVWPSEPPMDVVNLLHPQNSCVCWRLNSHTLEDCSGFIFYLTECLLMCKCKEAHLYFAKVFMFFPFWGLLWCRLTCVHSISEKNGLTA